MLQQEWSAQHAEIRPSTEHELDERQSEGECLLGRGEHHCHAIARAQLEQPTELPGCGEEGTVGGSDKHQQRPKLDWRQSKATEEGVTERGVDGKEQERFGCARDELLAAWSACQRLTENAPKQLPSDEG